MAPELSPVELARLAGELGCEHLCLFTQQPAPDFFVPPTRAQDLADLRALLAGENLSVYGVTSFAMREDANVAQYAPTLALSAELGARYASVRITDPVESRAAETFARFCALALPLGIMPSIEFMALGDPGALERTVRIIAAAGAGKLTIDPLHYTRSGTALARLRQLEADLFGYVQICDGKAEASFADYMREAGSDRLLPGEGVFPLADYLSLAPTDRPVSMELPAETQRAAGVPAQERCAAAVAATRRVLASLDG